MSRELLYLGASAEVFAASPEDLDDALAGLAAASLLGFTRAAQADADASAVDASTAEASTVTAHRLVMRVVRERAARDGNLPGLVTKAIVLLTPTSSWSANPGRTAPWPASSFARPPP